MRNLRCRAVRFGERPNGTVRVRFGKTPLNRTAPSKPLFCPNGALRFVAVLPNCTVPYDLAFHKTAPNEFTKTKSEPPFTIRFSKAIIRTAPHRSIFQTEKTHRGSILHRKTPLQNNGTQQCLLSGLSSMRRATAQLGAFFVGSWQEPLPDVDTLYPNLLVNVSVPSGSAKGSTTTVAQNFLPHQRGRAK